MRAGKVRYVGCSNFLAYQLARAIGRSEALGSARFDSVQPRYNLLFREIERELLPLCAEEGIGVIPYNPIAGGLLTGKHRRAARRPRARASRSARAARPYQDRYWHDRMFDTVDALRPLADEAGMSLAHAGRRVGAREPGHHLADHRREPARAARRQPSRRSTTPLDADLKAAPRRAHDAVPNGRRRALTHGWTIAARRRRMRAAVGRDFRWLTSFPIGANEIRRWAIAIYHPALPPRLFWDDK